MSSITIRGRDPRLKELFRIRAAERGHSMEAKARRILRTALSGPTTLPTRNLYDRIRGRFAPLGGAKLAVLPREPAREPPSFN